MNRRIMGILAGSVLCAAIGIELVNVYYSVTGLDFASSSMVVISGVLLSLEGWAFKKKAPVVGGALLAASGLMRNILWLIQISNHMM